MNWRIGLSVVMVWAVSLPALAETNFEWKFEPTSYIDVHHVARQEIEALGRKVTTDTKIRFLFKLRPVKTGEAETELEVTVVACEDSSVSAGARPEEDDFKGFVGQTFRLTVDAASRDIELDIPEGLPEAVLGEEADQGNAVEDQFAKDLINAVLLVHLKDALMPLPRKAVSAGDTWENTSEVKVQPIVRMISDRQYVFVGQQLHEGEQVQKVTWSSELAIKPLRDEQGVFPFTIKAIEPTDEMQDTGTVLWHTGLKRPVRVDALQTYAFDMVMEIEGDDVKAKGKGSDSFKIRWTSTSPDEEE